MLNEGNQIHNFILSTFVILLRFRSRKYGFWFRKTAVRIDLVRNRIHIHQIKESLGIKQNIIGIWVWNQVFSGTTVIFANSVFSLSLSKNTYFFFNLFFLFAQNSYHT